MILRQASEILSRVTENWSEQYRNPLWTECSRRKRECCPYCEQCKRRAGDNVRLNVHHLFYDPKLKLWEHDQKDLIVLCESCHQGIHEQLRVFRKIVFSKLSGRAFKILNGALVVALDNHDDLTFAHALAEFVSNPQLVKRYADSWTNQPRNLTKSCGTTSEESKTHETYETHHPIRHLSADRTVLVPAGNPGAQDQHATVHHHRTATPVKHGQRPD